MPENDTAVVAAPLHTVPGPLIAEIVGVGFTLIVKLDEEPVHPATDGVTVIVEVIRLEPALVVVNDGTVFVPEADNKPVAVLLLFQVYVVPLTPPVNVTAVDETPVQSV